MFLWCLTPFFTSLSNGLGAYNGVSQVATHVIHWGVPYFLGRLYLVDAVGMKELAVGIMLGGLLYVPFCLFEILQGPYLHKIVYGFHQHHIGQAVHFGGWRPMVFMVHGLMVGLWMAAASLICIWLCRNRALPKVLGISPWWLALVLVGTTLLVKSVNGWVLLVMGSVLLFSAQRFRSHLLIYGVIALIPLYLSLRGTGVWSGAEIVSLTAKALNEERAQSLTVRFENERLILDKAKRRPILGWDGWNRNKLHELAGFEVYVISVTDSFWIIAFGSYGLVGLTSVMISLLVPIVLFLRRHPPPMWLHRYLSPCAVIVVILLLYSIDNLLNAMVNPVFTLALGGVAGFRFDDYRFADNPDSSVPIRDALQPL
jgi:O-antigen ligase